VRASSLPDVWDSMASLPGTCLPGGTEPADASMGTLNTAGQPGAAGGSSRDRKAARMAGRTGHGREPEPLDDILDCLAYVQAVHAGDQDGAAAAFDIVHLRLAGRSDAMVAPLNLACLIAEEAHQRGCDVTAILAGVRDRALTGPRGT
jgi:hypothetical protein